MPDARPIITLLTDFGERDCFVASMKGVILSINSSAAIVDLSHQIASHQIQEAGYFLKSCYRYFPERTIHVAVVDPGVMRAEKFVPVQGAYVTESGEMVIPYAKDQVKQAPKAPRDHVLDSRTEIELARHYELTSSR